MSSASPPRSTGSHALLAYAGSGGHASIDEAITDPTCRARVEELSA